MFLPWINSKLPSKNGSLSLNIFDEKEKPVKGLKVLLLTEHKTNQKKQWKIESESNSIETYLPIGSYTYQLYSKGFNIAGGGINIYEGETAVLNCNLKPISQDYRSKSIEERLKQIYGIDSSKIKLTDLIIRRGEKVNLDYKKMKEAKKDVPFSLLKVSSINDIKRWTGMHDYYFQHDMPILGKLSNIATPDFGGDSKKILSAFERSNLAHISDEYINGNSVSVKKYEAILNNYLKSWNEKPTISIFYFRDVVVEEGAYLTVGKNSSIFTANSLKIHRFGHFRVAGTCRIDVTTLEEFH